MFYNSFAKSINCYELLVYESAAKMNLQKFETVQRRIIRAMFFKTRLDTLVDVLAGHGISNVFELFLMKIIQELFTENRIESPSKFIDINLSTQKLIVIRRQVRG